LQKSKIQKKVNKKLEKNITVEGKEILMNIKKDNKQVIFISGHFSNFELMAMYLEKSGIKLSAIYRPLNNIFLNIFLNCLIPFLPVHLYLIQQ